MSNHATRAGLIKPPAPRLLAFIPLMFTKRRRSAGHKPVYAELNLTSMVDMLTILVVFLLQFFSASAQISSIYRDITLPESHSYRELEAAPIISISRDVLALNGDPRADVGELSRERSADLRIAPLQDDLVVLKNNYKLLHTGADEWRGLVIIHADKGVGFGVIKRVLYTCAAAGYANVNFSVQARSPAG